MQRLNVATSPRLASLEYPARPLLVTRHARERAAAKDFAIPDSLAVLAGMVVELEKEHATLTKLVVREALDARRDRVLVLIPADNAWLVVTAWTNATTDTHRTLDKRRLTST
jgi:mannose-1-phosphate guanylyltransferase